MDFVVPSRAGKSCGRGPGGRTGRRPLGIVRTGLALALLSLLIGCGPEAAPVKTPPPQAKDSNVVQVVADQMHQLKVVTVKPYGFRTQKQAIGQIAFNEDASTVVMTPFSGRVTRVLAKVGEEVKQGAPLFEIDAPEVAQAQTDLISALLTRDKAQSSLDIAQRQADRMLRLIKDKAASQRDVDQAVNDLAAAQSDFKTAEGALQSARNKLRIIIGRDQAEVERVERERVINPLLTIDSPIDGTVVARKVGPGQYLRSDLGDQFFSISNLSTMWLKANVPEVDIPLVRLGQDLEVRVAALPDRVFHARVIAIGASSDASTRRVVVRSEIPNPDGALKSEMFASFKISVGEPDRKPAVPVEAVIWDGDAAFVWVQRESMSFERRSVKLGLEQDGLVLVKDGLKEGDMVVSRGALFVDNQWRQ
jgi:cobalt-zinc-cadmium efflux system membrane fusion protein